MLLTKKQKMADAPPPAGVKRERDGAAKGKGGKGVVAPAAPAKRVKDAAVCCPLVYGSLAFWLGRKADEFHTHKWTLFVRGPHGEDLGYFVEKVVFKLHPSFAQPVREVTKPPFEVSEKGWGEFECHIRIHFKDPTEKPVEVSHIVKLYDGTTPQAANQPVVSEVYDEVVFTDPREPCYPVWKLLRHRSDTVMGSSSRRWRGTSTPSSRRSHGNVGRRN